MVTDPPAETGLPTVTLRVATVEVWVVAGTKEREHAVKEPARKLLYVGVDEVV